MLTWFLNVCVNKQQNITALTADYKVLLWFTFFSLLVAFAVRRIVNRKYLLNRVG